MAAHRGGGSPMSVCEDRLDSLATALKVKTDDLLTLSMMQAILGYTSKARWLRHARVHLRHLFPYLPKQPGYNKRLHKAAGLNPTGHACVGHGHRAVERRRVGGGLHAGRV